MLVRTHTLLYSSRTRILSAILVQYRRDKKAPTYDRSTRKLIHSNADAPPHRLFTYERTSNETDDIICSGSGTRLFSRFSFEYKSDSGSSVVRHIRQMRLVRISSSRSAVSSAAMLIVNAAVTGRRLFYSVRDTHRRSIRADAIPALYDDSNNYNCLSALAGGLCDRSDLVSTFTGTTFGFALAITSDLSHNAQLTQQTARTSECR